MISKIIAIKKRLYQLGQAELKSLTGLSLENLNKEFENKFINGMIEIIKISNQMQQKLIEDNDHESEMQKYKNEYNFDF